MMTKPAAARTVVAVASSAGGIPALQRLLATLPPVDAAVLIVQHLDPTHKSLMSEILGKQTAMPVGQAQDGDYVQSGQVYLAPPNHHLLLGADGRVSLTQTEQVRFLRPSADLLFESAAAAYGPHVIAVVLTGTGQDGTRGAKAIKLAGGRVIAQDEATSDFFGMPSAAIKGGYVDEIVPLDEIGNAIAKAVEMSNA